MRGGTGISLLAILPVLFQSTRPLRGGTFAGGARGRRLLFQSTRPLRGGTFQGEGDKVKGLFQSTRPLRGGTVLSPRYVYLMAISIHPPLAGRDRQRNGQSSRQQISIHPPLAGRDRGPPSGVRGAGDFNPPAPCGAGLDSEIKLLRALLFQSTRPCGAGPRRCWPRSTPSHFNPPALAGRDRATQCVV